MFLLADRRQDCDAFLPRARGLFRTQAVFSSERAERNAAKAFHPGWFKLYDFDRLNGL